MHDRFRGTSPHRVCLHPVAGASTIEIKTGKALYLPHQENFISMQRTIFRRTVVIVSSVLIFGGAVLAQSAAPATMPTSAPARGRGGARGPAPSATMPVIQRGTNNRHEAFLEIARKGDIDVLFIGDSITDFWTSRPSPRGGKDVWDHTFAPLKAANFGINADRTQNTLWRVQNGELDGFKAKVIVMMLGTNNIAPDGSRNTPADAIEGDKLILKEMRTRQPDAKILLLGVFPRGEKADDPYRPLVKQINEGLAKLADNQHIFYMDIGDKFLSPDGTLSRDVFPDALHPNEKGYQIWADAILPKVKELLSMK
jgi:lysophospholipase L1-like esterase